MFWLLKIIIGYFSKHTHLHMLGSHALSWTFIHYAGFSSSMLDFYTICWVLMLYAGLLYIKLGSHALCWALLGCDAICSCALCWALIYAGLSQYVCMLDSSAIGSDV